MWNYLLFQLIFFIFIQQFLSQIELQQNLQLNESFDQSVYFFWAAGEALDVHLACARVCYLVSYPSETGAVRYHMHCGLPCPAALAGREFYPGHSRLVCWYIYSSKLMQ